MVKCKLAFSDLLLEQSADLFKKKMKDAHAHMMSIEGHMAEFRSTILDGPGDFEDDIDEIN